jgi:hypothetical protein
MPCVRFELTIPASERAKTVHALDSAATVTGYSGFDEAEMVAEKPLHFTQFTMSVYQTKRCTMQVAVNILKSSCFICTIYYNK